MWLRVVKYVESKNDAVIFYREPRVMTQGPLVIDLDGTLIKTDLLLETASSFLVSKPLHIFSLLTWLSDGKTTLKARLADATRIDAASLPYNQALLTWLREEKRSGRRLVLATATVTACWPSRLQPT